MAGSLAATIGLSACYIIDSCTFIISASLLVQIRGNYNAIEQQQQCQQLLKVTKITTITGDIEKEHAPVQVIKEDVVKEESFAESVRHADLESYRC
mmetsp:Transcript_10750/g.15818  ORF Transcript_10750/g.15818 Transcript_10750/m.15818 type:complete len:96 (-) Transcript_10750:145-432(-)